jgi:hypothetical protein
MANLEIYKQSTRFAPGIGQHPPDPKRCACGVWSKGRWATYTQCSRAPKFDAVIDGVAVKVCAIHRPEKAAEREAAARAREDERARKWARQYSRPAEYRDALQEIAAGHNDARALAQEVLGKWGDL